MTKILMISHIELFGFGGGCLENRKYYDGLKHYAEHCNAEIKVISLDKPFEDSFDIQVKKTKIMDIMARIIGHSTYLFFVWRKNRKKILKYQPDMIVLGRSRMGFIAKDIKRYLPNCKVVVNMENLEYDYVDAYFANKKGIIKRMYSYLEKFCVYRDEKNAVIYADALNYLTKRDYDRTHNLYKPNDKIETILPICIKQSTMLVNKKAKFKSIIFIGSLGYGSNLDALLWFINNVWKQYYSNRKDIRFIIGGNNPTQELKDIVLQIPNIELHINFLKLEDIVPNNAMLIAPIMSGAGMKVKVAEALSMGLMITASDEALVGYEEIWQSEFCAGVFRANTPHDYYDAIEKFMMMNDDDFTIICKDNVSIYEELYSYKRSRHTIRNLCSKLL